jgi:hypothetical protein
MAASNPYTSFTITQPFLGAPLQFQPALGSKELEELIDIYVIGTATKQDKLSNVTIDFYNNATVDLNTGALVRRYDVFPSTSTWAGQSFEQSPTQSQSSGFSPPIFTPSPGSSATFGDSGYGSISLTPPNRNRAARASKKPKKDAEIRLPGFSIMTKDGVDVTSTAGRGTKTKEQREHAHLMRIMKACADCKRKKIRVSQMSLFQYSDIEANVFCSAIPPTADHITTCQEPLHLPQRPPPLVIKTPVPQIQVPRYLVRLPMILLATFPPSIPQTQWMTSCSFQKTQTPRSGTLQICRSQNSSPKT